MNPNLKDRLIDSEKTREILQILGDPEAMGQTLSPKDEEVITAGNKAAKSVYNDEERAVLQLAFLAEFYDSGKCGRYHNR